MERFREFVNALRRVDAKSFLPYSEDLPKLDPQTRIAMVGFYVLWKAGHNLKKLHEGWFYGSGDYVVFVDMLPDAGRKPEGRLFIGMRKGGSLVEELLNVTVDVPDNPEEFMEEVRAISEESYIPRISIPEAKMEADRDCDFSP